MLKAAVETVSFTDMMTGVADSSKCREIRERLVWFTSTAKHATVFTPCLLLMVYLHLLPAKPLRLHCQLQCFLLKNRKGSVSIFAIAIPIHYTEKIQS